MTARYGHDFADREASLEVQVGSSAPQPLVAEAGYQPFGPLASLALGNGLSESRSFDPRYRPTGIAVPGLLDQGYATDGVGNILSIDRAVGADRFFATYAYQDPQYFLTEGNGPWGRRAWTYDRIGNRLSEGAVYEDGDLPPELFGYSYSRNATGGNTPKLSRVEPAPGGEPGSFLTYGYDAAGEQTAVEQIGAECSGRTSFLDYSAERRLSRLRTSDGTGTTDLSYDGRGFLRRSRLTFAGSNDFIQTEPVYSSEGLLYARKFHHQNTRKGPGDGGSSTHPVTKHTTSLFYFAGRPVAQLRQFQSGGGADELLFLTTDHLGVPILATDRFGAQVLAGGLDPFGEPFAFPRTEPPDDEDPPPPPPPGEELTANSCEPEEPGSPQGLTPLETAGLFLRFPGQWDDPSFQSHGLRGGLYYNVHRWYHSSTGRYTRPDPLAIGGRTDPYIYGLANALVYKDPLGLQASLPPNPRDPFVPPIDPSFGSGPWGRRPDEKCCDRKEIQDSIDNANHQIGEIDGGRIPSGTMIGGQNVGEHACAVGGWCIPLPPGSFDPGINPAITDPCARYCVRVHEWFHHQDRRPWHLKWSDNQLARFWEKPAYEMERACLLSF